MKLEDCSKEELIYFIQSECWYQTNQLEFIVLVLRQEKIREKRDKAFKTAMTSLTRYEKLLEPYTGQPISCIPDNTLREASEAISKYEFHIKKYEAYDRRTDQFGKQINKVLERKEK